MIQYLNIYSNKTDKSRASLTCQTCGLEILRYMMVNIIYTGKQPAGMCADDHQNEWDEGVQI